MGPETQTPGGVHDNPKLVEEHENNFTAINKKLEWIIDEFKIVKDAWDIKDYKNGERDRKLKELERKANRTHEMAEDEDRSIKNMVYETREEMRELKGYWEGSQDKKKEENTEKKENKEWSRRKKIAYIGVSGAFIASLVINIILIIINYSFK